MAIAGKLLKNTAISFAAKFVSMFLGVISVAILTRSLGKEGFGEYSVIFAYLYIFSLFADFGFYSLLLREISHHAEEKASEIFSHIFALRLLFLFGFFGLALFLIRFFPYSANVKNNLYLGALIYFFISLNQLIIAVFQKRLRMFMVAVAEIAARSLQVIFFLLLVAGNTTTLQKFLIISAFATCVNFIILFIVRRKHVHFSFVVKKKTLSYLIREAWPLGVSIIFVFIYFKMDSIILSLLKDMEALGIYGAAYKIFENLVALPAMFVGLMVPLLTGALQNDKAYFRRLFQKTQDVLVMGAVPVVFGGAVVAKPLLLLVAGKDFVAASVPFSILLFSLLFIFAASLYGNAVIVLRKQKIATVAYAIGAIFNFFANWYFIGKFSYNGAAVTTLVTEGMVTAFLFLIVKKELGYCPEFSHYKKVFFAGGVMALILWLLPVRHLLVQLVAGASVYGVILVWLRVVSREELTLLFRDLLKKESAL